MKPARVIDVKILSLGAPERYAVRRLVAAALAGLQARLPGLDVHVAEIDDSTEIGKYASALVLPTLVVGGRVVCSGRFPSREEVAAWLLEAAGVS